MTNLQEKTSEFNQLGINLVEAYRRIKDASTEITERADSSESVFLNLPKLLRELSGSCISVSETAIQMADILDSLRDSQINKQ